MNNLGGHGPNTSQPRERAVGLSLHAEGTAERCKVQVLSTVFGLKPMVQPSECWSPKAGSVSGRCICHKRRFWAAFLIQRVCVAQLHSNRAYEP